MAAPDPILNTLIALGVFVLDPNTGKSLSVGDITNKTDPAKGDALVGNGQGGTVAQEIALVSPSLSNWQRGGISGKKMAWVGDSTTYLIQVTPQNLAYLTSSYLQPGGALDGVNILWFGANGNSLASFLTNNPPGYGVLDVIAAAPDLIVFSYGINDVRLGNTTQAQLLAMLKQAINQIRTALPNCDIILRMPNSFLTTDVGGAGYVVPNSSAQAYTDIMRNAYRALKNYWKNVVLYDAQEIRFNPVCPALSVNMNDQLHPSTAGGNLTNPSGGFAGIIDDVVALARVPSALNNGVVAEALATNYPDAQTIYARVVEDGDYTLIARGAWVTQGSGFLRFNGDIGQLKNLAGGDIVIQDGNPVGFAMTNAASFTNNAGNIQLGNLGAGIPAFNQTGGNVSVWRHKYANNVANKPYVLDSAFPAQQRCIINTGGSTFIRLQALNASGDPDIFAFNINPATDYLLHPDLGPISLAGASVAYQSAGVVQLGNLTGKDFTLVAGHYQAILAAPGGNRKSKNNPPPLRFTAAAVAAVTGGDTHVVSRGGYYATALGKLSAALTGASTFTLKKNGTAVAVLTFASGATTATVAWSSGTGFNVLPGDVMTDDRTVGVGAADMSVVFDL